MSPADRIRRLLQDRGVAWPGPIEHLAAVGSTNEWLKDRARQGGAEWSAVVADVQTAGRGRHGRAWVSCPGDLALSVLLRPSSLHPRTPDHLLLLPLAAGLAVAEAAGELGADAALKWPNDVVVPQGRGGDYAKLAGVLVEGVAEGERFAAVVGIGLNLVPPPAALEGVATFLGAPAGREVDRDTAAAAVLARLAVWYDAVARGEAGVVVEAFTARALPWWGRPVEVRSGETVLGGIARGIDSRGALLLELEDGTTAAVVSGEVRQVRLR